MERREVLKWLGSAAAISAFPIEALTVIRQASAQVAESGGLRTLNAQQNATVTTIAELIIPATDTPGAKGAKVNEFIDLLLTEWYEPADTKLFLAGLADVDARSRKKYSTTFVMSTVPQQIELLTVLDAEAMQYAASEKQAALIPAAQPQSNAAIRQPHSTVQRVPAVPRPVNFFYQMKKLTLAGYYTTEVGFTEELGKDIVPLKHAGCAPIEEAR